MPRLTSCNWFDAQVALHDRSQFEIQLSYDVSARHVSQSKTFEQYRVEAFFFFPLNLGVSPLNFPREDFYRCLRGYLRYRTPALTEVALLDPLNQHSPLNVVSFELKQLIEGRTENASGVWNAARLFACVVSGQLRRRVRAIQSAVMPQAAFGRYDPSRDTVDAIMAFCREMPEILEKYRGLLADVRLLQSQTEVTREWCDRLRHVDEFLTYRFDHSLAAIHHALQDGLHLDAQGIAALNALEICAARESEHRRVMGYLSLDTADPRGLALYTYRAGALKKIMEQVLYLDVKTTQETTRWRNLAAVVGAMVAALFAGFSDRTYILPLYQSNLWTALALFAVIYVLKDRMKEVFREYVWEKVSHHFPDNKLIITDPLRRLRLGRCREKIRYRSKAEVPQDVLAVRNANHVVDLDQERQETVITYTSDTRLDARRMIALQSQQTNIKHILRFSVQDLLGSLDDPTARVQFYESSTRRFIRLRAPKVYHLNVVFRMTQWDDQNRVQKPAYQRIRVVIDKNGIQHIDAVDAQLPSQVAPLNNTQATETARTESEGLF